MNKLTQKRVRELFAYNAETGELINLISRGHKAKAGKRSGGGRLSQGYRRVMIDWVGYPEHHIIWLWNHGALPSEIDHINGIRNDNRIMNLREVTRKENCKNSTIRSDNKSGVVGVFWDAKSNKWLSYIGTGKDRDYIGRFEDWFDAVCARKSSERKRDYHPNHGKPSAELLALPCLEGES